MDNIQVIVTDNQEVVSLFLSTPENVKSLTIEKIEEMYHNTLNSEAPSSTNIGKYPTSETII